MIAILSFYGPNSEGKEKVLFPQVSGRSQRLPYLHPVILPSTDPMSFPEGFPSAWSHFPVWGLLPSSPDRGYPGKVSIGYPPLGTPIKTGWVYPASELDGCIPWQDRMGHPPSPGDRAAERILATRRAVCLLRSHKRIFLFF